METCDLGENSPPFVSMPLAAMRSAVDFVTGERDDTLSYCCRLSTTLTEPKSKILKKIPSCGIETGPFSRT